MRGLRGRARSRNRPVFGTRSIHRASDDALDNRPKNLVPNVSAGDINGSHTADERQYFAVEDLLVYLPRAFSWSCIFRNVSSRKILHRILKKSAKCYQAGKT